MYKNQGLSLYPYLLDTHQLMCFKSREGECCIHCVHDGQSVSELTLGSPSVPLLIVDMPDILVTLWFVSKTPYQVLLGLPSVLLICDTSDVLSNALPLP